MVFEIRFQEASDIRIFNGHYFSKCVCFESVKMIIKVSKGHDPLTKKKLILHNVGSCLELYAQTDEGDTENVQKTVSPEP